MGTNGHLLASLGKHAEQGTHISSSCGDTTSSGFSGANNSKHSRASQVCTTLPQLSESSMPISPCTNAHILQPYQQMPLPFPIIFRSGKSAARADPAMSARQRPYCLTRQDFSQAGDPARMVPPFFIAETGPIFHDWAATDPLCFLMAGVGMKCC